MNIVDLIVAVIAVLSGARGWRHGLVAQLFEYGGGFLGLVAGVVIGSRIASAVTNKAGLEGALISLIAIFVGLSLGQAVGYVFGHRFGMVARRARLGLADSALGALFGVAVTVVSFWLIGSLLVEGPSRPIARAVHGSRLLRVVNDTLPNPPDVFAEIRRYLQTSGFPQVFAGLPRAIGPPVRLPSGAVARRAASAAQESTVRVVVPACGGTQLGSGWVAADGTVVTNAHVVAGGDTVSVQDPAGSHDATVVLFDPRTDVAVLKTSGLAGPALELDTGIKSRGTGGATLGYPGSADGRLVAQPAAVQASYEAAGRDIYGRSIVTREVYELRSPVRQGDSGGPFVLADGDVAGVVFAASTTDGDTGYALTGAEVADEVRRGSASSRAADTGACTR